MPTILHGQWCQTAGNKDGGIYKKAVNYCKDTRPMVFDVIEHGFWIKIGKSKVRVMCVPMQVTSWGHGTAILGFDVSAACGTDDNSTPIYKLEFTFEFEALPDTKNIFIRHSKGE
jgi:hypothetical protein